jgi:CTP synthase (UTP-ammonia lyase)
MVNSKVTKNHIAPSTVKQLGLLHRQKLKPYTLVTISGDPVPYKDRIINLETKPVKVSVKEQNIIVNFNILLLKQDKTVLGIT